MSKKRSCANSSLKDAIAFTQNKLKSQLVISSLHLYSKTAIASTTSEKTAIFL
ncbi:MAG TPA: hypothetical protein VK203_08305 [Nostocaceae cyanobacterium]|nr:hypothetical protein [Nostocaceae cyanobacterium]